MMLYNSICLYARPYTGPEAEASADFRPEDVAPVDPEAERILAYLRFVREVCRVTAIVNCISVN